MKKLTLLLFIPLVFACSDDSNNTNVGELQIGDIHEGGIIFYLDESGYSGRVASLGDLGIMNRWEGIEAAEDFIFDGYSDWYLPDIGTLGAMYNTIGQGADNIGDFADGKYWSTTEQSGGYTWVFNFGTGESESGWNPVLNFRIRAVRSF